MKKITGILIVIIYIFSIRNLVGKELTNVNYHHTGSNVFTNLKEIFTNKLRFEGKFVTVRGKFMGWRGKVGHPPVTRSDWVLQSLDNEYSIYCTGLILDELRPDDSSNYEKEIIVFGKVMLDRNKNPYISVKEINFPQPVIEKMVSVSQLLLDPMTYKGKLVGLLGVLTKGFGLKGERIYLLADPTGAITLEKLPKLYPKGTILRIRGIMTTDKDGLPIIKDIQILSAQP